MSLWEAFCAFIGFALAGTLIELGKSGMRKRQDRKQKP